MVEKMAAIKTFAQRKIDFMKEHHVKQMIRPDCGGGSYGCRVGMKLCVQESPDNEINYLYLYEYLVNPIQSGRIKRDKSVNVGKIFTWHDSGKHGRELERHFGKGFYAEPRWIMQQCADNFVHEDVVSRINDITGIGVDDVLEITGAQRMYQFALDVLEPRGTVALIANPDNSPDSRELGGTGFPACTKTLGFSGLFNLLLYFSRLCNMSKSS
jgi:hypothetical protein